MADVLGSYLVTQGIDAIRGQRKFEVQRTNMFELYIEGLPQDLLLMINSTQLPQFSTDPIIITKGNKKSKVAGDTNIEGGEIQFLDAIEADTENTIMAWYNTVYDPVKGKVGWASDYKKNGYITQFSPDGSVKRVWKIVGVWPNTVTPGELNQESPDKKMISVGLQYDEAYRVDADFNPLNTVINDVLSGAVKSIIK